MLCPVPAQVRGSGGGFGPVRCPVRRGQHRHGAAAGQAVRGHQVPFLAHRYCHNTLCCRVPHLVLVTNSTVHRYTDTDNIDTQPVFSWVQVSSSSHLHHLILLLSWLVSRAWCLRPARPPRACPRPPPPPPPPGGRPSHLHPGGPRHGLQWSRRGQSGQQHQLQQEL